MVDQLETLISTSKSLPVGGISLVDKKKAMELVDQLRLSIPQEVKAAGEVLAQKRAEQLLMVALAGRASEEEFLGEVSAGAASDIQMATEIARRMVTEWGMSPRLGLVNYAPDEEQAFGQGTIGRPHNYSDETALAIDEEVRRLVDTGFNLALEMLKANREKLEAIAQALIKYETLDHEDLVTLIEGGDLDAKRRKDADDRKREVAAQKHRQMEEAKAERAEAGETGFVGPGASRSSDQPDPA